MKQYLVVIERAGEGFSAYLPDLPGCIAAGDTEEEALELMAGAIRMHIEGLHRDGIQEPDPVSRAGYISA